MSRPTRWIMPALLLLAAGLRLYAIRISSPVDDAYITFRYARNLAAGYGFVYNFGERVLGTTTPMFALLLTPFAWLGVPLDRAAAGLAVAASLAVMVLLARLIRGATARPAAGEAGLADAVGWASAGLYGLFYAQIVSCGYGMESPVFELAVLAALVAAREDRPRWSGAAAGFATLVRPEGTLLALLLGAAALLRRVRQRTPLPWGGLAAYIALVLPWVVFAGLYFGSFIPNSALAKASQSRITFVEWGRFFVWRNPVFLILWGLAALGTIWAIRRRAPGTRLVMCWAGSYAVFYLVARPPFLGIWYFPPLASPLIALATLGALAPQLIWRRLPARGLLALLLLGWTGLLGASAPRAIQTAAWSRTIVQRAYLPMASWVREQTGPEDLVEVPDIGYVGYFSGRRILDAGGLVSPELWREYAARPDDPLKDARYTLRVRPRVLLLPMRRAIYQRYLDTGLLEQYEPLVRFSADGSNAIPTSAESLPSDPSGHRWVPDYLALRLRP